MALGAPGARTRGMLHQPEGPPRAAWLFCAPLLDEQKNAQRTLVAMARAAAAAGDAVLRLDLRGCGDSDLDLGSVRVADWLADLGAGLDWLADRCPGAPLGLLGLRLGATLAAQRAEADRRVRCLALWEPVPDGGRFLDETLRRKGLREMLTAGKASTAGDDLDLDGFRLSSALAADLRGLSLPPSPSFAGRLLLLQVSATTTLRPALAAQAAAYARAGAALTAEALREIPFWNQVEPVEAGAAISATTTWAGMPP